MLSALSSSSAGNLAEGEVEDEPAETELPIERERGAAQQRELAQRLVLGILLEGLESAGDIDEPGQALAQGRDPRADRMPGTCWRASAKPANESGLSE